MIQNYTYCSICATFTETENNALQKQKIIRLVRIEVKQLGDYYIFTFLKWFKIAKILK